MTHVASPDCIKTIIPEKMSLHNTEMHQNAAKCENTKSGTISSHQYLKFHAVLLEDVDVNWPINSQGDTPLLLAIKQKNVEEVQMILESGCDVSTTNKTLALELALYKLRRHSHLDIIRLLLMHGAQTASPFILSKVLSKIYYNSTLYNQLIQTICDNATTYLMKGALLHGILQSSQCFYYPKYNGRCENVRRTCEMLFTAGTHPAAFWDTTFNELETLRSYLPNTVIYPYVIHIPWYLIPTFIQAALDKVTLSHLAKESVTNPEILLYPSDGTVVVIQMLVKVGAVCPAHILDKLAVIHPHMHTTYLKTQRCSKPLKDLCRICIRSHLKTVNAFQGIQMLNDFLPTQILDFLLLRDYVHSYFQD